MYDNPPFNGIVHENRKNSMMAPFSFACLHRVCLGLRFAPFFLYYLMNGVWVGWVDDLVGVQAATTVVFGPLPKIS
jgi:hypothetical protein